MRKLVIALLMALIAISFCVSSAFDFSSGHSTVGGATLDWNTTAVLTSYELVIGAGVKAHITDIYAYASNDSAGNYLDMGVYDELGMRLDSSSGAQLVNGAGWYHGTLDCYALNGTILIAVGTNSTGFLWYYDSTVGAVSQYSTETGSPLPVSITLNPWGAYQLSAYILYEVTPIVSEDTVSVDSTSIGALVVAIFLVLLNVLLIIKPVPLLGFSVAMITFGSVLLILGYNMPYAGMFAMMLSVVSVISIARSAKIYRGD